MVGNGVGAKLGILFKNAVSLEESGKVQVIALDKTGTITSGQPKVTDVIPFAENAEEEQTDSQKQKLMCIAYALESKSEHPLAKAIIAYGDEQEWKDTAVEDFTALPGNGLVGQKDGQELAGGNLAFIQTKAEVPGKAAACAAELAEQGKTPLFFAEDGKLRGIIAVADTVKEDSQAAVTQLKDMGIHVVMLTGDNERTAKAIGEQVGVDEVIADVLPDGKEAVLKKLAETEKGRKNRKTAMVGDGINDAPALTRADIGIAIGAGTDVAIEAADVVLMKNSLMDVSTAIRLSRATLRNIHENLFWAFIYNVIGIPLAAGVWYPLFGWKLNPMFGAAAMSLSSFCVVTNALRLNLFGKKKSTSRKNIRKECKQNSSGENKTYKNERKEVEVMTKTMKIKGMMCGHCEASVKNALEALAEVEEAAVSHEAGTAVLTLKAPVADEVLKAAVEEKDYEVLSID
jgi:Cu2+-exporting ATPase